MERIRKPQIKWNSLHENMLFKLWELNLCALSNYGTSCKMYRTVARKLNEAGFQLEWKDVRTKVDNLIRIYKNELRKAQIQNRPTSWRHFDTIHQILQKVQLLNVDNELMQSGVASIITKQESFEYDEDLPTSFCSGASKTESTQDYFRCSATENPAAQRRDSINIEQLLHFEATLEIEKDQIDRMEALEDTFRSSTFAESSTVKKSTNQMSPFELAMLQIERDRTDKLEHIARCRLEVMKRMAAENAEFHRKILELMKCKK